MEDDISQDNYVLKIKNQRWWTFTRVYELEFYYLIRGVYNYEIWGVRVCIVRLIMDQTDLKKNPLVTARFLA